MDVCVCMCVEVFTLIAMLNFVTKVACLFWVTVAFRLTFLLNVWLCCE